ncbi:MAG: hypothetical protein K1X74_09465 [Pirellulales bacterium]|nr:hypothetical protein [Pirellulales bacterium]
MKSLRGLLALMVLAGMCVAAGCKHEEPAPAATGDAASTTPAAASPATTAAE